MRIELVHTTRLERRTKSLVERIGKRHVLSRDCRETTNRGDVEVRRVGTIRNAPRDESLERCVERAVASDSRRQSASGWCRVVHRRAIVPAARKAIKRRKRRENQWFLALEFDHRSKCGLAFQRSNRARSWSRTANTVSTFAFRFEVELTRSTTSHAARAITRPPIALMAGSM